MSTKQVRKRIVFFHSTGPFKGLARICGLLEGTPEAVAESILPSVQYRETQKVKTVQHWKTLPRSVWYREWALESAGTLNDFHGAQV